MSLVYEVEECFKVLDAIGESRHQAKKRSKGKTKNIHGGKTMKQYISHSITFARWAREHYQIKHLADLREYMGAHYLTDLIIEGKAPSTLKTYRSALRKLQRGIMVKFGYHVRIVPDNFKLPSMDINKRINRCAYSQEEVLRILTAAIQIDQLKGMALQVTYRFGLRVHELVQLRSVDLETNAGQLKIFRGKGGLTRWVPIRTADDARLLQKVKDGKAKMDLIFPFSVRAMQYFMEKACDAAGIEVHHLHNLRHSFANYSIKRHLSTLKLEI